MGEFSVVGAGDLSAFQCPEALSESERVLTAYFAASKVGLAILDPERRYLAVNRTLAEINGVPASEHLGKTLKEILGDLGDMVDPQIQGVISSREPVNFEVSATLPTRRDPGYWYVHYLPILNASGAVSRVGAVVVETTAQKVLEKSLQDVGGKLRKEMNRLQMLLDVSSILVSTWDLYQVFPLISARVRRVFRHEYAGFKLRQANTGMLIRQAEDFPLGKGLLSAHPVSPQDSPGGRALRERTPLIFSREQLQEFESEITGSFLAEGLQSLCCIPLALPNGVLGVLEFASTRANAFQLEDLTLLNQVGAQLALALENQRVASEVEALKERLAEEKRYLEGEDQSVTHFAEIVGDSPALKKVLEQITTVASSDATVLILGETGTGKELVARAIHRLSRRDAGPFIKVNCAAIPTGLLESELFGHEKGAFTGAISQKVGRMELADGGTLFLDEVGEIPLDLQPKLLRALQDQEFERLGSNRTIKVNVRVIAATNRELAKSVALHQFRSDLFYRLNVFPVRVPPLRERREDIPLLIRHYVRKFALRMKREIETIPSETIKALTEWSWPGNVRELENLMERSVILSDGAALYVPLSEMRHEVQDAPSPQNQSLDTAEREHILHVLRECRGIIAGASGAARRLGLKRTTLQSKMQRLKITRQDYVGS